MPAIVILGAQWGDEGKGKATDLLATQRESDADSIDFVVRTSGGHNAGHTIVIDGETTTPLAMTLVHPGLRMPLGSRCVANFSPSITMVWPALWPPLVRTTKSMESASDSR